VKVDWKIYKKPILSPKDRPVHKTNLTKTEDRSHIFTTKIRIKIIKATFYLKILIIDRNKAFSNNKSYEITAQIN